MTEEDDSPHPITPAVAARYLGVRAQTIYNLAKSGKVASYQTDNGPLTIDLNELTIYLNSRQRRGRPRREGPIDLLHRAVEMWADSDPVLSKSLSNWMSHHIKGLKT